MAPETGIDIFAELELSAADLETAARAFTEEAARIKPSAEEWSALECVEHVVVVEIRAVGRMANAPREGAPRADSAREAIIAEGIRTRRGRVPAPEVVRPFGKFATLAEAMEAFREQRLKTIQFARDHAAELESMALAHSIFGPMNGRDTIITIANHGRRHAAQMDELRGR